MEKEFKEMIAKELEQFHCSILLDEVKENVRKLKAYGVDEAEIVAAMNEEELFPQLIVTEDYKVVLAAEEPVDADFDNAAVYAIQLPKDSMVFTLHSSLLKINYRGDVARLYAKGKIVADNFYNGRPFLFGLWRLPKDAKELELRILPLQQDMPVYFPREADTTPGEEVKGISIEPLNS